MSKCSYRVGYVSTSWECGDVSYRFDSAPKIRERSEHMDAFAKHIHGNKAFSLDSVARAVEEALAKKAHQS